MPPETPGKGPADGEQTATTTYQTAARKLLGPSVEVTLTIPKEVFDHLTGGKGRAGVAPEDILGHIICQAQVEEFKAWTKGRIEDLHDEMRNKQDWIDDYYSAERWGKGYRAKHTDE